MNELRARVSFIEGSGDAIGEGVSSFRAKVVPVVRQSGGKGALLLIDRQSGKALAITLWEDDDAMRATEERADELRQQAAEEAHATALPRVERYDVEVFDMV